MRYLSMELCISSLCIVDFRVHMADAVAVSATPQNAQRLYYPQYYCSRYDDGPLCVPYTARRVRNLRI